jgi:hypothetical protein
MTHAGAEWFEGRAVREPIATEVPLAHDGYAPFAATRKCRSWQSC